MEMLLKNVTEPPQTYDGHRYLIESTWPEAVQDFDLGPYRWIQELAPSYELTAMAQQHRWTPDHFQRLYWLELDQPKGQAAIEKLFAENEDGLVTFLYAGDSRLKSNAFYLKKYISKYGCPVTHVLEPMALAA